MALISPEAPTPSTYRLQDAGAATPGSGEGRLIYLLRETSLAEPRLLVTETDQSLECRGAQCPRRPGPCSRCRRTGLPFWALEARSGDEDPGRPGTQKQGVCRQRTPLPALALCATRPPSGSPWVFPLLLRECWVPAWARGHLFSGSRCHSARGCPLGQDLRGGGGSGRARGRRGGQLFLSSAQCLPRGEGAERSPQETWSF